jgi:DNA helicase HerA-like ATPase
MTPIGFKRPESDIDNAQELHTPVQDFRHVLIKGATGSGKTTSLILPILKNRILTNNSIVFLEYKGNEHRKIKCISQQAGRLGDIIEIGKPTGAFINLLALFDSNMIKDAIVNLCGGEGKDPYWSSSASQLAIRVIELQRKLQKISQLMIGNFDVAEDFFTLSLSDTILKRNNYQILKISDEISFATLSKIIQSPTSITRFFHSVKELEIKIELIIKDLYKKICISRIKENKLENLLSEYLLFSKLVDKYSTFSIQENDEASGNNGVLQILQNAISTLATMDYMNKSEIDILQKINDNAIIIIDIQSFDSNIYSIFMESLLRRLGSRIKYEIPKATSIFIDEANRVLTSHLDLHNDILRESRVELILATQNEEQMQIKFGEIVWESIVSNIRHHYKINESHHVWYNDREFPKVEPLLFNEEILDSTEYTYNSMAENLLYITNRFIFENPLPTSFKIIYDIHTFVQDSTLMIQTSEGEIIKIKYIGEVVKNETKKKASIYKRNL